MTLAIILIGCSVLVLALVVAALLTGFTLGSSHTFVPDRIHDARLRALQAERDLHATTRQAFQAMSEAAERRQRQG